MKNNWKEVKLGDACDITSSKRVFMSDYVSTGIPFYRSKEIIEKQKGNKISTLLFITDNKYQQIKKQFSVPEKDDLLLTSVGTLGIPYIVKENEKFYFKDGNLTWFRKYNNILPKFLYYFFISNLGKQIIQSIAIGTTQKAITIINLKNLKILLPPSQEQKRIAEILSSFDDKIELLQKQNKTLEDMAKTIFKSWFVDFDIVKAKERKEKKSKILNEYKITKEIYNLFPDSFENSELGKIPKGWEVKKLKNICNISSGKRPNKTSTIETKLFNIPVYGGNGIKWYSDKSLFNNKIIITGRVGTLGQVYRIYSPCWVSDNALVFITKENLFEYIYNILSQLDFHSFNRGSTQPLITQTDIKNIVILFNDMIILKYHNIVSDLYNKIESNKKQIQTLSKIRDALLPKLISGEIEV